MIKEPLSPEHLVALCPKGLSISDTIRWLRSHWYLTGTQREDINKGDCEIFAWCVLDTLGLKETNEVYLHADPFDASDEYGNKLEDNLWPGHYWVTYYGKHYDSESPDGVECWHDLAIFKKFIKKNSYQLSRIPVNKEDKVEA